MKIKSIRAKNFLSYGEEGLHINFEDYGNIILLKGKNLDIAETNASNASGKSSLLEVIVYALYGKVIRELPHKEIVNKKNKKGLEVEICFDEYKVIRRRKPDGLELYKNDVLETLGGMPSTQSAIIAAVGLNYDSFVNIACFGEHNNHSFLSCDAATKRTIVENLLGLERYTKYSKTVKEKLVEIENKNKFLLKNYELLRNNSDNYKNRVDQIIQKQRLWKNNKDRDILRIDEEIVILNEKLNSSNSGSELLVYKNAQNEIETIKAELQKSNDKKTSLQKLVLDFDSKIFSYLNDKTQLHFDIKRIENEVYDNTSNINKKKSENVKLFSLEEGVICEYCCGEIHKDNCLKVIHENNAKIEMLVEDLNNNEDKLDGLKITLSKVDCQLNKLKENKKLAETGINNISISENKKSFKISELQKIKEPKLEHFEEVLNNKIEELNKRKVEKINELDPYVDILVSAQEEFNENVKNTELCRKELDFNSEEIPYYEFWVKGFGDNGIRSFIIDEILPALNSRINYWLQFLIDNKINVEFNRDFDAIMNRNPPDGDPFVISATSGGERRRINLAISQAFAYMMMVAAGKYPSLVFLDEVALNVDVHGVMGIYKMICELSSDRQVIVTTHDQNLADLMHNCDVINVVKKDGISKIESKGT